MPAPDAADPERAMLEADESGKDSSSSGSDGDVASAEAGLSSNSRRACLLAGSLLAAVLVSCALWASRPGGSSPRGAHRSADASGSAVVLSDVESTGLGLMDALAKQMDSIGKAIKSTKETYDETGEYGKQVGELENSVADSIAKNDQLRTGLGGHPQGIEQWVDPSTAEDLLKLVKNGSFDELAANRSNFELIKSLLRPRPNGVHNQNLCNDDEEEFGGLCYKKCHLLTDGQYPVRSTGISCCKERPCQIWNTKFNFGACSGFSVGGDSVNGGCPHTKGACYADEEMYSGVCFRKCELLTQGEFNWRGGPKTCCKFNGPGLCSTSLVGETKDEFAVSGGQYENVNLSKASPAPHKPMLDQTEQP